MWQTREGTESIGTDLHQLGRQLVAPASERASACIVSDVHTGCADRCHSDIDLGVIHERQRVVSGPSCRDDPANGSMRLVRLPPKEVGEDVVMHVDRKRHAALTGS